MRFCLILLACAAHAQNAPHIRDWKRPASDPTLHPKVACATLHRLTGYDLSVLTVDATAESCRVLVQAQPEIRMEITLPANWNRRLYMFGNGGFAGEDLEAPGRVAHRNAALKLGFAVAQTNTGHDAVREPGATFSANQQKMLDWAFRSLHVTAETAKRTIEAFYGVKPVKSYFNGCSTGGRQAMILAQRYPEDFDGIIAGAPGLEHVAGRMRSIATYQAITKAPIPTSKLKLLGERVYERWDALDGLKDGLIDDPRKCDFKPSRDLPVCANGDSGDCFTAAQVKVLEGFYSDLVLNGKRIAPGFPVGAEVIGPNGKSGWDGWILRDGQLSQSATFADGSLKWMVFPKPDPNYDIMHFNLEKDAHHVESLGKLVSATDPDLTRFQQRGGKLLMYFGWADPALNAITGINYYESVQQKMGAGTPGFFRLYLMPGVFHCGGGVGPACFDPLANLIPWVEQGKAPESIVASQLENGKTLRTRPLCPYPQVARYKGSGSVDDAANFRCTYPNATVATNINQTQH